MRAVASPRVPRPRTSGWSRYAAGVVVTGELDLGAVPAVRARLDAALARRPACLQVDLSGCTSLDSSAVALLLSVQEAARHHGVVLVLVRPSPPVRRLLCLLALDEAFALG